MYAIIATGGKQYKVSEGDIIKVEKLGVDAGQTVTFDQVLAVSNGELAIGAPTVSGATVSATVLREAKDRKIIVYKYKPKKRLSQEKRSQTALYAGQDRQDQCLNGAPVKDKYSYDSDTGFKKCTGCAGRSSFRGTCRIRSIGI